MKRSLLGMVVVLAAAAGVALEPFARKAKGRAREGLGPTAPQDDQRKARKAQKAARRGNR